MNILYISKLAPQLGMRRIYEIGRRLASRGHRVVALCAATHPSQPKSENVDGVEVVAISTAPKALRHQGRIGFFATRLPFYLLNPRWVRRNGSSFDVIVEDVAPLWSPGLPGAARDAGVPLVYQIHNAYPTREDWVAAYGWKGLIGHLLHRRMTDAPRAVGIYADSKWSADALSDVEVPVRWIPNGADLEVFRPDPEKRRGEDSLVLLNVARLVPLKNHRLLIRAVANARGDVRLRVLGDGPEMGRLRRLVAELGVEGRVTLEGHAGPKALLEAYQSADVFVLPSLYEGMPQAVLEAMACGLPVAMGDIPAAEGVVQSAYGWTIPPRDRDRWIRAIERWVSMDRTELRRMGEKARAAVAESFTWDLAADAELEFLDSLASIGSH